jgi:hypothetical protein
VLVEIPLPWPREITEHPALVPVAAMLKEAGVRVQRLVPGDTSAPDDRRVVWFSRPEGAFDRYRGTAWSVADDRVAGVGAGVQVWRTSLTGGHRFAPTALLLAEGTLWADLDLLVGVSDRSLDVDEAARLYRGCAGLDCLEVQAVEREALRASGWLWFDHGRRGEIVALDGDSTRVRLDAEWPDGRRLAFEATVEVARLVPVPDCGKPLSEAKKSAPELRASGFAAA